MKDSLELGIFILILFAIKSFVGFIGRDIELRKLMFLELNQQIKGCFLLH